MIVGLLTVSSNAQACCGHCGSGHGAMMGSGHADQTGMQLDSDQQARIAAIRSKYNGDFTRLRSEMRDSETALSNELSKDTPDIKELKRLRKQSADADVKMQSLYDRMNQEIDGVLTDAQKDSARKSQGHPGSASRYHDGHGWCGGWDACPWTW